MGIIPSTLRSLYFKLKSLFKAVSALNADYSALLARISASPGLPQARPTEAFWQQDSRYSSLSTIQSETLPEETDIVIIGSGITACSIARTILSESLSSQKPRIVVLEARNVCSGATGRNGGHIKCTPYEVYSSARAKFGVEKSKKIVNFQMSHLGLLVDLAESEGWNDAEVRVVETGDFYFDECAWAKATKALELLQREWPLRAEELHVWSAEEASEKFAISDRIYGAISYTAGALWPYRLVTACFTQLLKEHGDHFTIEANTPVCEIQTSENHLQPFKLITPRGSIRATHLVHATNGYAAHLLPGLRTKLFPVRGHMSAQQPGLSFPADGGDISWSFINKEGFEYITQRPGNPDEKLGGEIMAGGGLFQSAGRGLDEIGNADDSSISHMVGSHLLGVLSMGFAKWGDARAGQQAKSLWTGVMGFTADLMPLIGKLETDITRRRMIKQDTVAVGASVFQQPAEWISCACNGEGMVNAWLGGMAVALQIMGLEDHHFMASPGRPAGKMSDWLPEQFNASSKRIAKMEISEISLE